MHLKESLMVEGICAETALNNVWSSNPFKNMSRAREWRLADGTELQ